MYNRGAAHFTGERTRSPSPPRSMSICQQIMYKIRSNIVIFIIGVGLLSASTVLLFWNEGRATRSARSLDEATSVVRNLLSADEVLAENNGWLVHFIGTLSADRVLHDDVFPVYVNAIKLKRNAEMYQWIEIEHKREVQELDRIRVDTTYSYSKEWKTELIDSNSFDIRFGHQNPEEFAIRPVEISAEKVQVGKFFLSPNFISMIKNYKPLKPDKPLTNHSHILLHNDMFYLGSHNIVNPEVGDVRLSFEYAGYCGKESQHFGPPDVVSIIGQQNENQVITGYQTESGNVIELLYIGPHSAQTMFAHERMASALMTWLTRFVGWLLMFFGFGCMSSIVSVLVDWTPAVHNAIHLGAISLNAILAISGSLLVIALGWLWYRPLLGSTLLLFALLPYVLLRRSHLYTNHRPQYDVRR